MRFIDLKAQYAALKTEIDAAVRRVISGGQFIMGDEVEELEREICECLSVKHTVSCANGTDALQMLYMAYGVGRGDAVFCPDVTFVSSVEPAFMLGATPVFCDIDPLSYNLCPASLERQIEAVMSEGRLRPRAIVAVDIFGNPADYNAIKKIAVRYGLILIEDAAQSFGGEYEGKKCGALADSAITSFFPVKPLGCYGDGGAVMTDDDGIAALCRSIRIHGQGSSKYENARIGLNSRLDTIQAAILRVKLKALKDYEIHKRQEAAARYNDALAGEYELQLVAPRQKSAFAQYVILSKNAKSRGALLARLKEKDIPAMVYYPLAQHRLEVFKGINGYGEAFGVADSYCSRTVAIPFHPYLEPEEQDKIIEAVLECT
ncbi:MAG: DegT/DnrJ/EryC1/StrS family aminotransferase [Oscillospiraceae bacterium]|jgi:dTDP-4-amino-4,6-dideoxygalactose transaminase|nr:DegT/DnrJ/EryC1/StrS family aminotransferase [Oscillospiraceae bacterium]